MKRKAKRERVVWCLSRGVKREKDRRNRCGNLREREEGRKDKREKMKREKKRGRRKGGKRGVKRKGEIGRAHV